MGMFRSSWVSLALVLVSLILGCLVAGPWVGGVAASDDDAPVVLAADEWCPYNCAPGAENPGYMVEIAKRVLGEAGYEVQYQVMPWTRALLAAERGQVSGVIGAIPTEVPQGFVLPRESLGVAATDFFIRRGDNWRYTGIDSLAQVRVGVIRDYGYNPAMDAYIAEHEGFRVQATLGEDALQTNIRKLLADRIDVVVSNRAVFFYTAKSMTVRERVAFAGSAADHEALYIAFSAADPRAPELARLLDEGIRRLRASGELDTLLAPYGLVDWQ